MAKLLTEEQYNELMARLERAEADTKRLDWMLAHNGKLLKCKSPAISCNVPDRWVMHGDTPRDAIDKAMGEFK